MTSALNVRSSMMCLFGDLPPSEKTTERPSHEAVIVIGVGTETTARALAYIPFELIQNPKMVEEL